MHYKACSLAGRGIYTYIAAHKFNYALRYGHAKSRALYAARGGGCLPLESLKDLLRKLLRHTYSAILNGEVIAPGVPACSA